MSDLVGNHEDRFLTAFLAGYGGPTCLESTCTYCSNTGELTLDLTTGDVIGTLTNATVLSMAAPTSGPYASVDCNYQARVKVT